MAKLQRNFIKGKMNKSLDERLVPNGEYIDALNVRIGSTELSEIGSVENSKGNTRLTFIEYNGQPLSDNAKCIGAYEDGAEETIYWFVTDPSHTGGQATGKLDLIVSYNTNDSSLTYHVISVDDGGGINTTLNFNSQYLITGVDKVDNLLFFTDNYNQPRVIDVEKAYLLPSITLIDGRGNPELFAESLLVVKKPPLNSPTFELKSIGAVQNFLVDRFICFAYRYRYENDQYSATSQFTNVAFIPKAFDYDEGSYLNTGMENFYDTAIITFNTGSELVVGIDLLFKEASNPVIRVIEKLDKEELGYGDNQEETYEFSNNKIYTVLEDNEILRLYDNVPLKAQAQTIMGSRLVYGNYVDGFELVDLNGEGIKLEYEVEYNSENIALTDLVTSTSDGLYNIDTPLYTQIDSEIDIYLGGGIDLIEGSRIDFSITFSHGSFTGPVPAGLQQIGANTVDFSYILQQDFNTVQDLQFSQDFGDKIGRSTNIQPILDACDGTTLTDLINCLTPLYKIDSIGNVWTKTGSGINNIGEGMSVLGGAVDHIRIKLPATQYSDGVSFVYEYYEISITSAIYQKISQSSSLHSNRDYEVGIIYMDEYNRSTSVLISPNNIVHIPCSESDKKNTLRVEIPTWQLPPSFATRYKFAIKQDREIYETIYSNVYFNDTENPATYFLLEGENAQKVTEGDRLYIKADTNGPLDSCRTVTVLEKVAQEKDFIVPTSGEIVPQGVYMKIRNANIALDFSQERSYSPGQLTRSDSFFLQYYPDNLGAGLNFDSNGTLFPDYTVREGTRIEISVEIKTQKPGFLGVSIGEVTYNLNNSYTATQDYIDIIDWWNGDNIGSTLGSDSQGGQATYNNTLATVANVGVPGGVSAGNVDSPVQGPGFRWYVDGVGRIFLLIGGYNVVSDYIRCNITIITQGENIIFETEPQDAAPDVWYESSVSYPITGGFHEGNVQNQTALLPAIIDTAFENCFAFGNGAESYKIRDSITRSSFGLGNRVNSVLKGEEYKQVHRFADLTYSGTYNYNSNNLNEFNLGLLNFKSLEPSFGFVRKLFARSTDILVLQEDKISYVLAGKNLLSDSAAGGAITSVPEVLGTQIARIEEYGISHNPESFAQYGYDKYFTDSKRGVLLQLKGSSYNNDQLVVISNFGMSSWFRNLFLEDGETQKLGGYDPYMKEYVLSSNEILLPFDQEVIDGGEIKEVVISDSPLNYDVILGGYVGVSELNYNVKSIVGTYELEVIYDSISQIATLSSTGSGLISVNKNKVIPNDATINITNTSGGASDKMRIEFSLDKPIKTPVTIIQVCVSDRNDNGKSIQNQYRWTSSNFNSPLHSNFVSLSNGTTYPLISQYSTINGNKGNGVVPVDGDTVYIISKKLQSDDFEYDTTLNKLGYLRTNTLYNNNTTDIASLLTAATFLPPPPTSGGTGEYYDTFTMPASTDQYLYLIYDYRKPTSITLCYSNTSADDACCGC